MYVPRRVHWRHRYPTESHLACDSLWTRWQWSTQHGLQLTRRKRNCAPIRHCRHRSFQYTCLHKTINATKCSSAIWSVNTMRTRKLPGIYSMLKLLTICSLQKCRNFGLFLRTLFGMVGQEHQFNNFQYPKTMELVFAVEERELYVRILWSAWISSGVGPVDPKFRLPMLAPNLTLGIISRASGEILQLWDQTRNLRKFELLHYGPFGFLCVELWFDFRLYG